MKKHRIRRAAALTAVTAMLLFCASPVLAADSEAHILEVDVEGFAIHHGASLSGPEVDENGILHIERGKSYDFTYQAIVTVGNHVLAGGAAGHYLDTAFRYARTKGLSEPMHETWLLLENDGDYLTFARPVPDSEISLQAEFTNVRLSEDAWIREPQVRNVVPHLEGTVSAQAQCIVDAVARLPLPDAEKVDGVWVFPDRQQAEDYADQVTQALNEPSAQLEQPAQAVLRMQGKGALPVQDGGGYVESQITGKRGKIAAYRIGWPQLPDGLAGSAVWELEGETLPMKNAEGLPLNVGCSLVMLAVNGVPLSEEAAAFQRSLTTTAGAAALGLGGGAAANALSSALENMPAARRREEEYAQDAPDLPGEDTPSVSMEFYRPFDDLVNTKGAAVNIPISLAGGEGMNWHYLPTAVCPESLKAVIPAVMGSGSEATLVLNLTGAAMKKPHVSVFVTVIAWAVAPDGQNLRTTGTMELTLHRPGLEAERTKDGSLQVVLYTDSNLNGVAEKVVLKPEQYDCRTEKDGTLLIQAKHPYAGSCRLASETQQDKK